MPSITSDPTGFATSRAILIGVSSYEDSGFPSVPAARNSLQAMRDVLNDETLCGWPLEQITVIPDPNSAPDLGARIADLAEETTDVLLLYYVGHGTLTQKGDLCLTVSTTRENRARFTGLPWDSISEVLRNCPAKVRLAILDCCFSGQAIEALSAASEDLADITHIQGVYTLTATMRNRTALVPSLEQQESSCTYFTGELCELIRAGIPAKPAWLTLADIYPVLRQQISSKGLPEPNQRGTHNAPYYPFTRNVAYLNNAVNRAEASRAVVTVANARQILFSLAGALVHAVSSAIAAAAARAQAEDLARELSRERETEGLFARTFHRVGDAVQDGARAAASAGVEQVARGLAKDRDKALDRARSLANELAKALNEATALERDRDEALAVASSRANDLANALTNPSARDLAATTARAIANTRFHSVKRALAMVQMDASGLDLSDLKGVDPGNLSVLVGVIWTDDTIWPTNLADAVRERSHEIRPGIYQVDHLPDDTAIADGDASLEYTSE